MKVHPLIIALATVILTASTATAQQWRISAGYGWMLPTGDYSSTDHAGWQLMGAVEFTIPHAPVGLRLDGMYGQTRARSSFEVGSLNVKVLTANLVYQVGAPMARLHLYLLAGMGNCVVRFSDMNATFAAGTGVSVAAGSFRLFVEGRLISARTSGSAMNFFPVTGGLSFGL